MVLEVRTVNRTQTKNAPAPDPWSVPTDTRPGRRRVGINRVSVGIVGMHLVIGRLGCLVPIGVVYVRFICVGSLVLVTRTTIVGYNIVLINDNLIEI